MGQTQVVNRGSQPESTRASRRNRIRRAIAAVAISGVVAIGVAAPMALRVQDEPAGPTTTAPPSTTSTSTTTTTTVPVQILGSTTIRDGD